MQDLEPLFLGRTFDDFLFRPQHSPVARRRDLDLTLPLAQGLELSLPVVGANMDTVVGEEMAKTLALEGALDGGRASASRRLRAEKGKVARNLWRQLAAF
jgi:IMP dehydrogenase/GMP reductase